MTPSPSRIVAWIAALPNTFNVQPCRVRIGNGRWPAARYKQTLTTPEGSRAWNEGQRQYVREMLYAVGPLPPCYRRSTRVAFTIAGEPHEWYIAGHYPHDEPNEFHPFGRTVLFAPWDYVDAIDRYQPRPYRRVPLTLTAA